MKELLEEQGLFDPSEMVEINEPIRENEKKIGEMNDLEKFLWSFLAKIPCCMDSNSEELDCDPINHNLVNAVDELLALSIKSRCQFSKNAVSAALREGFQIVEVYDDSSTEELVKKIITSMKAMDEERAALGIS